MITSLFGIETRPQPSPEFPWSLITQSSSVWSAAWWFRTRADVEQYAVAGGWENFAIIEVKQ